jgi:hypothetical protein
MRIKNSEQIDAQIRHTLGKGHVNWRLKKIYELKKLYNNKRLGVGGRYWA